VNLLFVHGLKDCPTDRQNAQNTLVDLESAIRADLPSRIASYAGGSSGRSTVV
jgi:hypothetical protein